MPDVEAASRALARAGFAPTPVSIQVNPDPGGGAARRTGTGNVTAMLREGYIEVLFKTADTPLASELEAAMARYRGIHLAAFAVADAAAFHRGLASRGFRVRPLVNMQRPVDIDGAPAPRHSRSRGSSRERCRRAASKFSTHHTEAMVWQPRWLSHPNGALALLGVVIAVADVEEAARRYAGFTGRATTPSPFGHTVALDRGHLDLVSADGFRQMLPEIPIPSLPFIGACKIKVASLALLRDMLKQAGMETSERAQGLVAGFPEEIGHGAWLFKE